jgi:adenylyltransferase/sulfurtransferase
MSARDEVLRQVPDWDMDRIRAARILVVGAGALGNEVLKNLALMNVGQVAIMDFDRIEASNLSRSALFRPEDATENLPKTEVAARRLREMNPEMSVLTLNGDVMTDLGLGILRQMDLAIGCIDNRLARLYLNRWCFRAGIPWVNGGILNLSGQLSAYHYPEACYECGLSEQAWRDIRIRMGCADMGRRYAMTGSAPTTPIAASVIGALQVQEALRLLHEKEGGLLGKMFNYEGKTLHSETYELLPPREECDSHYVYDPVEEGLDLSAEMQLGALLDVMKEEKGLKNPVLSLDHPLAVELVTLKTNKQFKIVIPQPMLSEEVSAVLEGMPGEGVGVPKGKLLDRVGADSGLLELRLIDLGIPHGHIVTIREGRKRYFVELSKDLDVMNCGKTIARIPNQWFEYRPEIGGNRL